VIPARIALEVNRRYYNRHGQVHELILVNGGTEVVGVHSGEAVGVVRGYSHVTRGGLVEVVSNAGHMAT
jgi:hypothetical protein